MLQDVLVFKEYRKDEQWSFLSILLNNFLKRFGTNEVSRKLNTNIRRPPPEELEAKNILYPSIYEYESLSLNDAVVTKCLDYLYVHECMYCLTNDIFAEFSTAYKVEGLFRLSGSASEVRNVYNCFKLAGMIKRGGFLWILMPSSQILI